VIRRLAEAVRRRRRPRAEPLGRLVRLPAFGSKILEAGRDVVVYLPPGYGAEPCRRYPVLYVQDGQNLFEPHTAYVRGKHWRLGETAGRLIREGTVEPLLIVGVGNAGGGRIDEYTPTRDARRGEGGKADLYGRFLLEELIPFVDARFRTEAYRRSRGLAGSSLGGLVSLYLALKHPGAFGKAAALSPSVWWDRNRIVRMVRALPERPDLKIWLDIGTEEGRHEVKRARLLRDALAAKGWTPSRLRYLEAEGAVHDEAAWGDRAGEVLAFLFPARPALRGFLSMPKGGPPR
jgi:predicted alpha/beta superfamily hydrolase